ARARLRLPQRALRHQPAGRQRRGRGGCGGRARGGDQCDRGRLESKNEDAAHRHARHAGEGLARAAGVSMSFPTAKLEGMKVRQYMATQLVTFVPEMTIAKAVQLLVKHKYTGAPV